MTQATFYTGTPISKSWPAGSKRALVLDLSLQAVSAWQPDVSMAAGALIRPTIATESADGADHSTGYVYQNGGTAGQTGALEPAWPKSGTVTDGSCTWTPVVPPASGADTIASAAWTVTGGDGLLTIASQTNTSLTATANLTGGTSGKVYTVTADVTMASGLIYPVVFYVTTT